MARAKTTKSRTAAQAKEDQVLGAVATLNPKNVSDTIGETQVQVQETLAGLSAKILEKLQLLRQVEESIQLKNDELKEYHDIEAKVIELDELQAEIDARHEEWDQEQARKKREFAEQQAERNRAWKREEEEYDYQKRMERRQKEDEFTALIAQKEKENRERQEQLEKLWKERETELARREGELVELREKVAGIPELIKKEVNAAVAIATNSVKKEYETKAQLAQKDAETAEKLANQQIQALQSTIDRLNLQVEGMRRELDQAHQRVTEISAKALDSAAGRSTIDALQRALEKDQGQKSGK
jgi:colicin import membrane protein